MSMRFDLAEHSVSDSVPVRLYEFRAGAFLVSYADGDRDVEHNNILYKEIAIGDDGISAGGRESGLTVTVPGDCELAGFYVGPTNTASVGVIVRELQWDTGETEAIWVGSVGSVGRSKSGEMALSCKSILSNLDMTGLRMGWGRRCPYTLFDRRCKLQREDWAVTARLAEVSATGVVALEVADWPANWFTGGYIEWPGQYGYAMRYVEASDGMALTLLGGTHGLSPGMQVTVYPGCAYTGPACAAFGNLNNHGGVPGLPTKNPHIGQPIF